jgi:hypothetical protein
MNYIRECPVCSREITHKRLRDMNSAKEKGSLCMSCCKKGNKNPFFGKSHKKETLEKIILTNKSNIDKYRSVEFCKENGYTYEMVDPVRISDDLIKDLHESGRLKFTDRYELKFIEKFN